MAITYEPIATQTLASAAASITFSSIPATYTDLKMIFVGLGTTAGTGVTLTFNSDTGANYSSVYLQGNGTDAASATNSGNAAITVASVNTTLRTANQLLLEINFFSYTGATNKTLLSLASGNNDTNGGTLSVVGLWRNTAVINTITIASSSSTFAANATATLYGIKNA